MADELNDIQQAEELERKRDDDVEAHTLEEMNELSEMSEASEAS